MPQITHVDAARAPVRTASTEGILLAGEVARAPSGDVGEGDLRPGCVDAPERAGCEVPQSTATHSTADAKNVSSHMAGPLDPVTTKR